MGVVQQIAPFQMTAPISLFGREGYFEISRNAAAVTGSTEFSPVADHDGAESSGRKRQLAS